MSQQTVKNIAHSVNAKLKNYAIAHKITFEYVLLRYALERFLYRLSVSVHSDRFILKGASAFSVWFGPMFRVTRDADLYSFGNSDPDFLLQCFKEICSQPVSPDGVIFDLNSMCSSEIKKDQQYKGTRIEFNAFIDQARVALQFDIGFGDAVFPPAEKYSYPVLLDFSAPQIKVYPQYTVIAEKFEAMVSLGMKNSRLKDFFDIWLLCETFDFDFVFLKQAIAGTFKRRNTDYPTDFPIAFSEEFYLNPMKVSQWNAFIRKIKPVKAPNSLQEAIVCIKDFLSVFISEATGYSRWLAGKGWQ